LEILKVIYLCRGGDLERRWQVNGRHFRRLTATVPGAAIAFIAIMLSAPLGAQGIHEICSGEVETFALPDFTEFDSNEDGFIDRREARQCSALAIVFSQLDLDGDEHLTPDEYSSFANIWAERVRSFGPQRSP
jgi:hypothetical protein